MPTPIIVPITNTRTRDCIVQDGQRYCEDTDLTPREVGFIIIGVVVLTAYLGFLMWLNLDKDIPISKVLVLGIALPLLVLSLFLIFL
jgi:hypothetical protein